MKGDRKLETSACYSYKIERLSKKEVNVTLEAIWEGFFWFG